MDHYFTNNENLKSEIHKLTYKYDLYDFSFLSDNGVFAKNKLDYGSAFLIDTLIKNKDNEYKMGLDVGCGYGFIGITLAKILNMSFEMIDINKRAVHLTNMNIKENKVDACAFESNVYDNIDKKYDLIVTNPPIRAGKNVVLNILEGAFKHLNENGELWFVIRKDQGAKSFFKILNDGYNLLEIDKSKGFYVFKAKNR